MKKIITLMFAIATIGISSAQTLKFRTDGTFKIAQFTDIHFKIENPASDSSLVMINEVLDSEKPDLVIFSGDIVTGEFEGWTTVLEPVQKRKIPFAVVLGNHDDEQKTSRKAILEYLEKQPFSLTKQGDYVLFVNNERDGKEAIIYMFDSNSYSTRGGVDGYGWFTHEQVQNYIATSRRYMRQDVPPMPALAFFHIPLPEYTQAFENKNYPPFGQRNEAECSPKINTGMFAAMRIAGDIMGCFVGHDHINDYMAYHYDIALAYGRWSGSKTTYGNLTNGSRIITLHKGVRKFDSHLRLRGGATEQYAQYPRKMNYVIATGELFKNKSDLFIGKSDKSLQTDPLAYIDGIVVVDGVSLNRSSSILSTYQNMQTRPALYTSPAIVDAQKNVIPCKEFTDRLWALYKPNTSSQHKESGSYSWNFNGVHFVQCNITSDDQFNEKIGEWLEKDLKSNGKQPTIMLIHQIYSPDDLVISLNQKALETLMEVAKKHNIYAAISDKKFDNTEDISNNSKIYITTSNDNFLTIQNDKIYGISIDEHRWNDKKMKLESKNLFRNISPKELTIPQEKLL